MRIVDLVQGEISSVLSFWTELRKSPLLDCDRFPAEETATNVLAIWAKMQRFPRKQINQELWKKLDSLVRSDTSELLRWFVIRMKSRPLQNFSAQVIKLETSKDAPEYQMRAICLFRWLDDLGLAYAALLKLYGVKRIKKFGRDVGSAEASFMYHAEAFCVIGGIVSAALSEFDDKLSVLDPIGRTMLKHVILDAHIQS